MITIISSFFLKQVLRAVVKNQKNHVHIGTSGWSYEHWREVFYPQKLASGDRLKYYSNFFSIVEVNSTFYHLPSEKTLLNWAKVTPKNFIFAVKASRYLTHQKKLLNFEESTNFFFQRIALLKNKLGPILFQLPPSFKVDAEILKKFISFLPKKYVYCIEFRNPSWYTQEIYRLLKSFNIALCFGDLNGIVSPLEVTANFVYLRLHGPKEAYTGSYSTLQLKKWAKKIHEWEQNELLVYCFFNNDQQGYAVHDAARLIKIAQKTQGMSPRVLV